MKSSHNIVLSAALVLSVAFLGCKKAEVEYYEIPKETTPADTSMQMPADHPPVAQTPDNSSNSSMGNLPGFSAPKNQTELEWDVPAGWVMGAESSMRIASYALQGVPKSKFDVSVTRFPGDVGGMFSNVNRWRGQLGLERYSDPSQAESEATLVHSGTYELHLFKMENAANPPLATEVAILELNGFSWFFKMTGEKKLVDQESKHFLAFLESIQPGASE